eukprot:jgi/Astpho2/8577/Aster-x0361
MAAARAEGAKLEAEVLKLREALASGSGLSKIPEVQTPVSELLAASKKRTDSLKSASARLDTGLLESKRRALERKLEAKQRGVDICFLMDCTGSMGPYIEACKAKVQEIMRAAEEVHEQAITRMAFVGYRDVDDVLTVEARDFAFVGYRDHSLPHNRFEVKDFLLKEDSREMHSFVSAIRDIGNHDIAEDVAGGLEKVMGLDWQSGTKLVIHFGDAPAHGRKYYTYCHDNHPGGDPTGLVPEDLGELLYAQINTTTDVMTDLFAKQYAHSQNAVFKVIKHVDAASSFVPMVVASIRDSMKRSAFFSKPSVASSSAAGSAKARGGDTMFHSIL